MKSQNPSASPFPAVNPAQTGRPRRKIRPVFRWATLAPSQNPLLEKEWVKGFGGGGLAAFMNSSGQQDDRLRNLQGE